MKFRLPIFVLMAILASPWGPVQADGPRFEGPLASPATGHPLFWIAILVVAGPAVVVLFHLLTGRPLPAWARARTFSGAVKAFFSSQAQAAMPTTRGDFDANRFLREAREIFLQLQARGEAGAVSDREALLAPDLRAELEARGRAPWMDAVENPEAEFLGMDTEDDRQLASVRFSGLVGDGAGGVPIAQVWGFARSSPAGRWMVTEIEVIDAVAATPVKNAAGQEVHRLAPRTSRRRQAWTALAIGLLFGTVGAMALQDAVGHEVQGLGDLLDDNLWVEFLVGGVFCLIGVLALWSAVVAFLSLGRQETIVEVAPLRFARGARVSITFRQPGPLALKSLRANLVGLETWRESNDKGSRDLGTHPLLDSGPQEILADHPYETTVTLRVPRNLSPSGPTAQGHEVEWVIEVYGKVSGSVDFAHSYPVQIC